MGRTPRGLEQRPGLEVGREAPSLFPLPPGLRTDIGVGAGSDGQRCPEASGAAPVVWADLSGNSGSDTGLACSLWLPAEDQPCVCPTWASELQGGLQGEGHTWGEPGHPTPEAPCGLLWPFQVLLGHKIRAGHTQRKTVSFPECSSRTSRRTARTRHEGSRAVGKRRACGLEDVTPSQDTGQASAAARTLDVPLLPVQQKWPPRCHHHPRAVSWEK